MNRIQFGLILFTVGFCLAFLASSLTSAPEPAWDPQESKSALFTQQTDPPARGDVYRDTNSTVSKWRRSRSSRSVGKAPYYTGGPRGARLDLVSFTNTSSTLTTCDIEPDNDQKAQISVTTSTPNANCSVFTGPPAATGGCSVSWTPPPNPSGTPNCSSTGGGAGNGGGSGQCSAGQGSPNNATTLCSTSGGSNQGGASTIACSAANAAGNTNAFCSASQGPNNSASGSTCSVAVGAVNATCSTGSQAAPGGQGGSCSTTSQDGVTGSGGANVCSVKQGANGGNCSSNGAGGMCSAGSNTGNNKDFCSVEFDSVNSNNCTVLGGGSCSAAAGASPLSCSVKGQLKAPVGICNSRTLPQ
jgi:hypothetical protein